MPTYEYECAKCKRTFERLQGFSEEPLKKCIFEGCNGKVHRLVSAGSGFIFKGNGFYETDYKKKGSGNGSSKKAKECPAAEGGSCSSCPNAAKSD